MKQSTFMLVVAALVAACGGGAIMSVPAPAASTPAASAPAPASAPASPSPSPQPPAWPGRWRPLSTETWKDPVFGGQVWQRARACAGSVSDPGSDDVASNTVPAHGWGLHNVDVAASGFGVGDGVLDIDSLQHGVGFGLLYGTAVDATATVSVSAVVDVKNDHGAMVGITLHNGEGNYRNAGLIVSEGRLWLAVIAPCYSTFVRELPLASHKLDVMYSPVLGWRFVVDDVVSYEEAIDYRGNRLRGQPRPGIWAVNVCAEASAACRPGRVRARVGAVSVAVAD